MIRAFTMALAALISVPATAQTYSDGLKSATILKGWRQADGTHIAAVEITLDKNWKTYWRVAGSGGIPPLFDWSNSTYIESVEYVWPVPSIFEEYGQRLVGYKDTLILPIIINPIDPSEAMAIDAGLQIGVCENVCIPVETRLQSELPNLLTHNKAEIEAALSKKAHLGDAAAQNLSCDISKNEDGFEILATLDQPYAFPENALVFVEYPTDSWIAQGKTNLDASRLTTSATIFSQSLDRVNADDLVVTVVAHQQALEIFGCATAN